MVIERSENNASGQASRAVFVANCSMFIAPQCAVRYGLVNVSDLRCIPYKVGDSFSTVSKRIKRRDVN